jgi:hypothetical protein
MRPLTAFAILMALAAALPALADEPGSSKSAAMKSYMYIKEDSDRFVGEGVAELKDFEGDALKAAAAAKERARGDLASNVRVQVTSDSSEKTESKDGKVTEELKSASQSHADVALENVKYMEFKDFPDQGQVTVLASLNKEDYRRQLAGKAIPLYRPKYGLRLNFSEFVPTQDPNGNFTNGLHSLGLDLQWMDWVAGLSSYGSNGGQEGYMILAELGYDWTPWASRFQLYVPLRLKGGFVQEYDSSNNNPGDAGGSGGANAYYAAAGGLGLRFWPNDSLSVDLNAMWVQGLNTAKPDKPNGSDLKAFTLTGPEFQAGISWSGF